MTANRFKSDTIGQDDVRAFLRSKDIIEKPTNNGNDLRESMYIISAIHRNWVRTSGKIEF